MQGFATKGGNAGMKCGRVGMSDGDNIVGWICVIVGESFSCMQYTRSTPCASLLTEAVRRCWPDGRHEVGDAALASSVHAAGQMASRIEVGGELAGFFLAQPALPQFQLTLLKPAA